MSRETIINQLYALTGAKNGSELLDALQEQQTISDLVLTVEEIPPSDLVKSLNKLTENAYT